MGEEESHVEGVWACGRCNEGNLVRERIKMDKEKLIKMYDQYYTKDSRKWSNSERNRLAFETTSHYCPEPAEILDIGCGIGHTLAYYQTRHCKAKMYGIDLSPVAIELAKQQVADGNFQATFIGDYSSRKKFEVILCMGSAEHFENLVPDLKKLKSLLKKDGIAYIEVPNNLLYSKGEHAFRQLRTGSRQWEWHLSKTEWEDRFAEAGLAIKKFYRRNRPQWEFCWILESADAVLDKTPSTQG